MGADKETVERVAQAIEVLTAAGWDRNDRGPLVSLCGPASSVVEPAREDGVCGAVSPHDGTTCTLNPGHEPYAHDSGKPGSKLWTPAPVSLSSDGEGGRGGVIASRGAEACLAVLRERVTERLESARRRRDRAADASIRRSANVVAGELIEVLGLIDRLDVPAPAGDGEGDGGGCPHCGADAWDTPGAPHVKVCGECDARLILAGGPVSVRVGEGGDAGAEPMKLGDGRNTAHVCPRCGAEAAIYCANEPDGTGLVCAERASSIAPASGVGGEREALRRIVGDEFGCEVETVLDAQTIARAALDAAPASVCGADGELRGAVLQAVGSLKHHGDDEAADKLAAALTRLEDGTDGQ